MAICINTRKQLFRIFNNAAAIHSSNILQKFSMTSHMKYSTCFSNISRVNLNDIKLNVFAKYNIQAVSMTLVRLYKANMYNVGPRPNPVTEKRHLEYIVHWPKDKRYTLKPLPITKMAGRDPKTGRIIFRCKGGGVKKMFRHVKADVNAPHEEGEYYVERVIDIVKDDLRRAFLAICCSGTDMRYRIATTSMKIGDIVKTTKHIPRVAVLPKEGDTHPLGALPIGTNICCIQVRPNMKRRFAVSAGMSVPIRSHINGKVLIQLKKKCFGLFDPTCLATVGQVSNPVRVPIGSPQALRRMGRRPRSGLWHKKSGRHGRKIKPIRTTDFTLNTRKRNAIELELNCNSFQPNIKIVPSVIRCK